MRLVIQSGLSDRPTKMASECKFKLFVVCIFVTCLLCILELGIIRLLTFRGPSRIILQLRSRSNNYVYTKRRFSQIIDCQSIFDGNEKVINSARQYYRLNPYPRLIESDYIKMTSNCSRFIESRGYITHSSDLENLFPIGFSILMYTDVDQAERLLRAIYRPQNVYCLHVDAKSTEETFSAVAAIASCFSNVFLSSKRFDVKWGTITVLEPELVCMQDLMASNVTWKYFINLTGQDLPLRTNLELVKILKSYNGANDIWSTILRYLYSSRMVFV